jgi:hypothetical protein
MQRSTYCVSAMLQSLWNYVDHALHANLADVASSALSVTWAAITGKPATYPPSIHGAQHLAAGGDPVPNATNTSNGLCPVGVPPAPGGAQKVLSSLAMLGVAFAELDLFGVATKGVVNGMTAGENDALIRSDDVWVQVAEERIAGRITGGRLTGLTLAQMNTFLGVLTTPQTPQRWRIWMGV